MGPGGAGAEPALGWFLQDGSSGAIYRRERLLGEGSFGRCYRVSEVTSGRPYALKVIPRARLGAAGTGDRVQRELELQGRLRHPHLVRLHGHFTHSDRLCLLLELCARGSLADTVRARGRLTEPEVRFYLRQLLSGLRYLHGHGLVHRDLKLSNFLLTEKMRVKIGDLGLAQPAAPPGRRWGALCGTPQFLAPEVLDRRGHAEPADIWALGCAVYTALTGQAPFQAPRRAELYRLIRGARYPPPARASPPARALIALMLHPQPGARPRTAALMEHPFLTRGFTPHSLPPHACHSVPILVGQEPLWRILQCWRGCACAPVTAGCARVPVTAGRAHVPVTAGCARVPVTAGPGRVPVTAGRAHVPVTAGPGCVPVTAGPGRVPVTAGHGRVPVTAGPGRVPVTAGHGRVPVTAGPGCVPVTAGPGRVPVTAGRARVPVTAGPGRVPVTAGPGRAPPQRT